MTTRRLLAEFDVATGPFNRNVANIDRRLERFQTDFERRGKRFDARWEKSARSIRRVQTSLIALAGSQVLRGLGNLADASTRVDNRLAGIGATSDEARAKLFKLSVDTRSSFEGNATVVQRFVKSTGDAYETNIRRIETLNKLFASAGTGQAERSSTLTQFSQGLQSGTLQGEELKALRENAPVELLRALAKEAGVTFEALKQAGADGKLTLDVMTRAVDSLGATADENFKKVKATSGEAFGVLKTGLIEFVGNVNDSAGVTDALAESLINVGSLLGESKEAAEVFGQALAVIGQTAVVVAGGRGLARLDGAIRANVAARKEAVTVAKAEADQARANVAAAASRVDAANRAERAAAQNTAAVNKQIVDAGKLTAAKKAAAVEEAKISAQTAAQRAADAKRSEAFYNKKLQNVQRDVFASKNAANGQKAIAAATRDLSAARAAATARNAELAAAEARVTAAQSASVKGLTGAKANLTKATKASAVAAAAATKSRLALAQANQVLTRSTNAVAVAQQRATLSLANFGRGIARGAKGLFNFMGGPFGLVVLALTYLPSLIGSFESLSDKVDKFATSVGTLESAQSSLRTVEDNLTAAADRQREARELLKTAIEAEGPAAIESAKQKVLAINSEIEGLEKLQAVRTEALAIAAKEAELNFNASFKAIKNSPLVQERKDEIISAGERRFEDQNRLLEQRVFEANARGDADEVDRIRAEDGRRLAEAFTKFKQDALSQAVSEVSADIVRRIATEGEEVTAEELAFSKSFNQQEDARLRLAQFKSRKFELADLPESPSTSSPAITTTSTTTKPTKAATQAERNQRLLADAVREREQAVQRLNASLEALAGYEATEVQTAEGRARLRQNEIKVEQEYADALAEAREKKFDNTDAEKYAQAQSRELEATLAQSEALKALSEREDVASKALKEANDDAERRAELIKDTNEDLEQRVQILNIQIAAEEKSLEGTATTSQALERLKAQLVGVADARASILALIESGAPIEREEISRVLELAQARSKANTLAVETYNEPDLIRPLAIVKEESEAIKDPVASNLAA